jgi:hypothetical protein
MLRGGRFSEKITHQHFSPTRPAGDRCPAATRPLSLRPQSVRQHHSAGATPTSSCFALGIFNENTAINAPTAVNTASPYSPPE